MVPHILLLLRFAFCSHAFFNFTPLKSAPSRLAESRIALVRLAPGMAIPRRSRPENPTPAVFNRVVAFAAAMAVGGVLSLDCKIMVNSSSWKFLLPRNRSAIKFKIAGASTSNFCCNDFNDGGVWVNSSKIVLAVKYS